METPLERRKRRLESAELRKKRLSLLAELDDLKAQECKHCKTAVNTSQYKCSCPAALRKREIGKELSLWINDRVKSEIPEEGRKVARNLKAPEMTEKRVSAMREKGMTLDEIANEFGVTAPTVSYRLQKWKVEKVREKRIEEQPSPVKKKIKSAATSEKNTILVCDKKDSETVVATIPNFKEGEINCGTCGKEIHLGYNDGELDQTVCCGVRYQTKHVRTDLIITRLANVTNH